MRRFRQGTGVSVVVHAAVIAAIIFAHHAFRENPITVIDFSLEKSAPPEQKKDPPVRPRAVSRPLPVAVVRNDAFPDTAKPVIASPVLTEVPEPVAPVAAPAFVPGPQSANVIDSTTLKKNYITAQYGVIRDKVYRALSYPAYAQEEGWQGTVKMSFLVNRDGSVDSIHVLKSSGFTLLDNNAVKAVRQAAPFPYAPAMLEIILPVVYRLE
jgi:protein TonB